MFVFVLDICEKGETDKIDETDKFSINVLIFVIVFDMREKEETDKSYSNVLIILSWWVQNCDDDHLRPPSFVILFTTYFWEQVDDNDDDDDDETNNDDDTNDDDDKKDVTTTTSISRIWPAIRKQTPTGARCIIQVVTCCLQIQILQSLDYPRLSRWSPGTDLFNKFKFHNSSIILLYPGCCHQEETKIAKALDMMKSRNN